MGDGGDITETYVYADILFLVNFSMDYLCLYISTKILRRLFSVKKMIIASAIGGLYSVISLVVHTTSVISLISDLLSCLLISAIVFHRKRQLKSTVISALLFFAVSMTVGGIMTALFNLVNKSGITLGSDDGDSLSVWGFALLAISAGIFSVWGGRFIFRKKEVRNCVVRIRFGEKEIELNALTDSGNLIRDPISGKPVIIVDEKACGNFVDKQILDDFLLGIHPSKPQYTSMRITSINTVNGTSALVIMNAERITVSYVHNGKTHEICTDAMFAVSNIESGEYDAIVPYSIFRGL